MKLSVLTIGAVVFLAACGGGGSSAPTKEKSTAEAGKAPEPAAAPAAGAAVDMAAAKSLFQETCAACHGASGKGDGPGAANLDPKPRDFSNEEYMGKLADAEIRNTIKYGGAIKGMPQMPSHPQFKEADLNNLVAYVRSMSQ